MEEEDLEGDKDKANNVIILITTMFIQIIRIECILKY
jgi:hypothetical protein